MRYENDGMVLWYGLTDTPVPVDGQLPSQDAVFTIGVSPPDASNRVKVIYAVNGGVPLTITAIPLRPLRNTQYFTSVLPSSAFQGGDLVRYVVVCHCAARQVPAPTEAAQLPSSFRVAGQATPDSSAAAAGVTAVISPSSTSVGKASATMSSAARVQVPGTPSAPTLPSIAEGSARGPAVPSNGKSATVAPAIAAVTMTAMPTRTAAVTSSPALTDVVASVKLNISSSFLQSLAARGIRTLEDVRHAAGLAQLAGSVDAAGARLIEAHADLARISSDLSANAELITGGFDSTMKIANAPRSRFIQTAGPIFGSVAAARIHVAAISLYRALDQVMTSARIDAANGIETGLPTGFDEFVLPGLFHFCQCCDCQAVQSPTAYLADLLSYITQNLQYRRQPVTLEYLVENYYQPFGDLPTDCEAVDQQVRQVRLCIEVLRRYLAAHQTAQSTPAGLGSAEAPYLLAGYSGLLAGLGTTYQELRLTRRADAATRSALADRLGLTINPYGSKRPDELDKLVLDLPIGASPSQPAGRVLSEAYLERLFGLADTNRNPLSDGPTIDGATKVINDPNSLITRWNLAGIVWGQNTSQNGKIYATLSHASPSVFRVSLYQDDARSALVASGEQNVAGGSLSGPIQIFEENSSGLSGSVEIANPPLDNSTIQLGAVPEVTSWQLGTLRVEWKQEDYPADPFTDGITVTAWAKPQGASLTFPALNSPKSIVYDWQSSLLIFTGAMAPSDLTMLSGVSSGWAPVDISTYIAAIEALYVQSQRSPIIDPDVIGPDDFRKPITKAQAAAADQPFDIWLRRRNWVDAGLLNLASRTKNVNGVSVPDIDSAQGIFSAMLSAWTYDGTTVVPWSIDTPVSSFEALWENLAEGVASDAIQLQLAADLGLSAEAFNRLMDIWHQDQAAALDVRNPPVTSDAWREIYSLLVEAAKMRLFPTWRTEEAALSFYPGTQDFFGSQNFVVSLREPVVGDWPPDGEWPPLAPASQPLIDPALITVTDLPEPTAGVQALGLWNTRSMQVNGYATAIRSARESSPSPGGVVAALQVALGNPLPDLDQVAQDLLSPDSSVVAAATATVETTLFMSVDAFNRLMMIRAMDMDPNPAGWPTPALWIEFYAILTSAETRRLAYTTWLTEETNLVTGPATWTQHKGYWTARKATLPLWRSSVDARTQWHAALSQRSSPPIIDPDLLNWGDFAEPTITNPALALWHQRGNWVNQWLSYVAPVDMGHFGSTLQDVLGVSAAQFQAIAAQSAVGTDITPVIAQLGLSSDAFNVLSGTINLLQAGVSIFPSEQADFNSILLQVKKQQLYSIWRQEEAAPSSALGASWPSLPPIVLGPDLFQLSSPSSNSASGCNCAGLGSLAPTPLVLPAWRGTQAARQMWEDTLDSRVEQQSTTITALENVVDAAESNTLTQLRDILVMATNAPGSDLGTKANWLTENLMIDAETGGCQKTTRIEQALETLQSVMNGVRDGQIGSLDIELRSAPAAISFMGSGRIDVFARGCDDALWHKWWEGASSVDGTWYEWESLGGSITSAPAVTSVGYGTVEVFARGRDNALWHLGYNGGWRSWESLGGVLVSAPCAGSQEQGSFDVFVLGTDGGLWEISGNSDQEGTLWGGWQAVGRTAPLPIGGITSAPAVVASGTGVYDVFVRGGDDSIWHTQFSGSWSGWKRPVDSSRRTPLLCSRSCPYRRVFSTSSRPHMTMQCGT